MLSSEWWLIGIGMIIGIPAVWHWWQRGRRGIHSK
jgi:hypothetical protein